MFNEELRKELEEFRKETENLKKVLERKIKSCDRVVIIPHNFADMDAIGSAIGLSLIATHFNKPYTIIDNDPSHLIEAGVKKIINECDGKYEIITKDKYMKKRGNKELYILTDVNKTDLICVKDILPSEDHIVIIDHHEPDDTTVKATQKFINPKRSSASEMVTDLLKTMEIDIPSDVATYLYSGIFLDTVRLSKPKSRLALHIAADLKDYGADTNRVNDYFKEDLESYLKVHESIKNIKIHSCMLAIIKTNEDIVYTKEELSKIADEAMILGADASFAIGVRNDNTIGISARSTGNIDINAIMEKFGGGGHDTSGAATITDSTIEEVYNKLEKVLKPSYYKER
jgi:c-di-AMP phosphodiesterase-like protein